MKSSLLVFCGLLLATTDARAEKIVRGPYLQQATESGIIVRWRTKESLRGTVRYGRSRDKLDVEVTSDEKTRDHEIPLSGLSANTKYFYSVDGTDVMHFVTAPNPGETKSTRIWVLGDSGTGNSRARAVFEAYQDFTKKRATDVWLMLGDNAYRHGEDWEFQKALFDIYPELLEDVALWSAVGNHDVEAEVGDPYYDIFNFPTEGEAGGVASGTEAYYSFDYGDIHVICLDSEEQDRSPEGPMLTWLKRDLAANTSTWTIACWHHSPYTKGSHDSDRKIRHIEMREHALPLLEAAGVDLVLGGHSHVYERSWFVDGFYGTPTKIGEQGRFIDKGNGRQGQDGAYQKARGSKNSGTVYVCIGSSGHATKWTSGSRDLVNPEPHVLMRKSLLVMGSLVVDIDETLLRARFLDLDGRVRDSFVIEKK